MSCRLLQIYEVLFDRWGPQGWWPAETPWEMMVGAVLTQNTAWTNVEKALDRLRAAGVLDEIGVLARTPRERIAEWIRPAGYFNQKSRYLQEMSRTIAEQFDGSLDRLFALPTDALRRELLSWTGVGPETADSILLYAAERPVFVVDAYTRRMLSRHGLCDPSASYDEVAAVFRELPRDVRLFNEFHALIVRLGKEHCRAKPRCEGCPLRELGTKR